jgi:hypothetical protein
MQPFLLGAVKILAAIQTTQVAGAVRDGHTDEPIAGAIVPTLRATSRRKRSSGSTGEERCPTCRRPG